MSAEWSAFSARGVFKSQAVVSNRDMAIKALEVVVAQSLRSDDVVQVGLHELLHEIDVPEQLEAGRLEDVEDGDNIFVAERDGAA